MKYVKKVEIILEPIIENISEYRRCWATLWLLPCTHPKYRVVTQMVYRVHFKNGEVWEITVNPNYVCDLASIPRKFWSIYPPDGQYRFAAIGHDLNYESEAFPREVCDEIFKAMLHENVPSSVKNLFHGAVKYFGWIVWDNHTDKSIAKAQKYLVKRRVA